MIQSRYKNEENGMQEKHFGKTFRLSGTVRILYTVKNDVRGGIKEKIRIVVLNF